MGIIDLKIQHMRRSKHWTKRHRRMKQLRTATSTHNLPPFLQVNPVTSTIVNVPDANGTTHQQIMDLELWEATKIGDVENFLTCLENFTKEKDQPLITTLSQLTHPHGDTFLHVAASYGHEELSGFIVHHFRTLVICKNHKGDSALHLAVRGGHLGVVDVILSFHKDNLYRDANWDDCRVQTDEERVALLKKRLEEKVLVNEEGNTALHDALLNGHKDIAEYLIKRNVEAAYYVNKQGKSPLHMVVAAGNTEYVNNILDGRSEHMNLLDEQLVHGESLPHAAIMGRNLAILQIILEKKPMLTTLKDDKELGLLEFASSIGFLEGVDFLQYGLRIDDIRKSEFWEGRHKRLKQLLDAEKAQSKKRKEKKPENSDEGPKHGSNSHFMNLSLYIAAKKGNIDEFIDALDTPSTIYNQMTPLKNTVLHVAASFGNEDLAGFLVHHFRTLLSNRNHRGDTALHMAAIAGHLGVVDVLVRFQIDQMKKDSLPEVDAYWNRKTLISKFEERDDVNDDGNTPLHEALKNNHDKVAEYLIKEKIEDAFYVNKQGKSALYMAIEAKKTNCANTILINRFSYRNRYILDKAITKGKSLLHATITARNLVLLQKVATLNPAVIHVKDEYGQTPLHHAAELNFLEGVDFLVQKFKMAIYEKNAYGFYPIHSASKNGYVGILKKLLQHCPDAKEFVNEDTQNILHVAAMYGKDSVVRYILSTPELGLLLNEKDKDGYTPLHLATINWHPKVVSSLTWDKRVDLGLVNTEGLTAIDSAEENMEAITSYRQRLTWMALKSAGTEKAKLQNKLKLEKPKSATNEPYNMDHSKDRVNTLLLVSTLVATVTFAAGFTMPGGYNNTEPNQGMSTLLDKFPFQVFVICDTIALYSAIMVAVSLIWAQLGDLSLVLNALKLAIPLLGISLTMMSLAFMVGVYLVVSKLVWLANFCLILGIISLTCLLSLFIPLNLPYTSTFPILRHISYYPFCLLMLASGSYYDPDIEQNSI